MSGFDLTAPPAWLQQLVANAGAPPPERLTPPDDGSGRHSAVLMLFSSLSGSLADSDLLLILRAADLRAHAGQVAFPGGATDPGEESPIVTALREANEEVGLDPASVDLLAVFRPLYLARSDFVVTPVLGFWRAPHPVGIVDPVEVAGVARVSIPALLHPSNRFTVQHPSGLIGAGFEVDGMFIWGFTAAVIDRLLRLAGWEQPWDAGVIRPIPTN